VFEMWRRLGGPSTLFISILKTHTIISFDKRFFYAMGSVQTELVSSVSAGYSESVTVLAILIMLMMLVNPVPPGELSIDSFYSSNN